MQASTVSTRHPKPAERRGDYPDPASKYLRMGQEYGISERQKDTSGSGVHLWRRIKQVHLQQPKHR